jgi:threonine dehydrogenase-like Zn-dependent dehydrogenase
MRAVCWCGPKKVRVESVPDPKILRPRDAIVRITLTTICGSDLHLYGGFVSGMKKGDILGHEMVGEIVETGPELTAFRPGDRVVVSSVIACGQCWYCKQKQFSLCDNSNPNFHLQEPLYNDSIAAVFGYSHTFGGYAGAQAQYIRVPYADVGAFKIPAGMTDAQALACSDVFPTGFMAAEQCGIHEGDVVAVWGCGPVGQFAIKSAQLLGAQRVIAIDDVPERLRMAELESNAVALNFREVDIATELKELTGGRGPDACIDAVGLESHAAGMAVNAYDRVKQALRLENDRAHVVREMIHCCRKGGAVSIFGAYTGYIDKFPLGIAFSKGLRFAMAHTHGPHYIPRLLDYWRQGLVDPSFIFTHRASIEDAPEAYEMFRDKDDGCVKFALTTGAPTATPVGASEPIAARVACE